MENNKNKRIEEYFANLGDLDLISEKNSKREFPKYYTGNEPTPEYKPPEYKPYMNKQNNHPSIERKKTNINKSIQKSISKTEIKKKDKKGQKVKILKAILIGAISIIITASATEKVYTHIQTEQIKRDCIEAIYNELDKLGYNIDNINIVEIINNSDQEYLKENLFEFYLIIDKNVEYKEKYKMYNLLVQKAGLANSFEKYLINKGYHNKQYYSSNGEAWYYTADVLAWENEMEAIKLAEKTIQETKSKGAR